MKILKLTLVTLMLFAAYTHSAQTKDDQKIPINVSRVVIEIKEGELIGNHQVKSLKSDEPIELDEKGLTYFFNREFRINSSFYEEELQRTIEKSLIQNNFAVSGWGSLFPELQKDQTEFFSLGLKIESLAFKFNTTYGQGRINSFQSVILINAKVLNKRTNQIAFDKMLSSKRLSNSVGGVFTKEDFKKYIDEALNQFITELIADTDFKKMLEEVKSKASYPTNYEKITIAKVAAKADKSAALKSALDAAVTVVTGASTGSGVIISKDGLVLTCSHVVEGNETVEVILSNRVRLKAKVLRNLPEFDTALLQIEGVTAAPLPIGSSEKTDIGEDVWVIGTPKSIDLGQSVTKGILSGRRVLEEKSYLQTDASVSPGNSGGPIINQKGEILGIVNAKVVSKGTEGVGFAIPIDVILEKLGLVVN